MQKAYFVIGVAFAARGCEINEVDWKDVSRLDAVGSAATGDGSTGDTIGTYRIRYYRSKAREAVSTEPEYCFIHDSLQVQVLDNYFAFWPAEYKHGTSFLFCAHDHLNILLVFLRPYISQTDTSSPSWFLHVSSQCSKHRKKLNEPLG